MISFTHSRLYKDIGSKVFFTMATLLMPLLENVKSFLMKVGTMHIAKCSICTFMYQSDIQNERTSKMSVVHSRLKCLGGVYLDRYFWTNILVCVYTYVFAFLYNLQHNRWQLFNFILAFLEKFCKVVMFSDHDHQGSPFDTHGLTQ